MISDTGVVAMPLCITTAQGLLGCMASEPIFPLQAQPWGACEHCKPLLSSDLQSLSLPRWLIWLTQNEIWRRRTDHALTCLRGIAEPSSEMAWLLWTRGSTFWRGLGRDAKTHHTTQLCSESFCGSSQEALRDRTKGSGCGATGLSVCLSVIQRTPQKRPPGCIRSASKAHVKYQRLGLGQPIDFRDKQALWGAAREMWHSRGRNAAVEACNCSHSGHYQGSSEEGIRSDSTTFSFNRVNPGHRHSLKCDFPITLGSSLGVIYKQGCGVFFLSLRIFLSH